MMKAQCEGEKVGAPTRLYHGLSQQELLPQNEYGTCEIATGLIGPVLPFLLIAILAMANELPEARVPTCFKGWTKLNSRAGP